MNKFWVFQLKKTLTSNRKDQTRTTTFPAQIFQKTIILNALVRIRI